MTAAGWKLTQPKDRNCLEAIFGHHKNYLPRLQIDQLTCSQMPAKYSRLPKAAAAVSLIAIAASIIVLWSNGSEKSRRLRLAPAGLGVSQVVYAREESWGFGPGGNETGVIMFELPVEIASSIEWQGIGFLDQYMSERVAAHHGSSNPFRWKATPVRVEGADGDTNSSLSYDINKYLNRYGFGILIDKEVARNINDALSSQGNFVDDNGRRLIILMPKAAKLVVAYSG